MTPGVLPNLIVGGLVAGLALFVTVRRPPPALWPVLLLYPLAGLLAIAGFVLLDLAPEPWSQPIGALLVYGFGTLLAALCWVVAVRYAEAENRPFAWGRGPWFALPLGVLALACAVAAGPAWRGLLPPPEILSGGERPWAWFVLATPVVATTLASVGVFLALARRARDRRVRRNAGILAAGLLGCVLIGLAGYSGLRDPLVHPAVLGIALTNVLFLWGAYRTRWFAVLSAALRKTLLHDPDGVVLVDGAGCWLHSNPAAAALLGCELETPDRDVMALIAERVRHADQRAITRSELVDALLHPADPGGGSLGPLQIADSRWLRISSTLISSRRGVPLAVSLRLHDVTDLQLAVAALRRHRDELEGRIAERTAELEVAVESLRDEVAIRQHVEAKLMQSRERHRAIAAVSSDLAFAFRLAEDGEVHWEWVSRAVTDLTGYEIVELARMRWPDVLHPDDVVGILEQREMLRLGRPIHLEVRLLTKTGITRWLELHVRAKRDDTGSLHAVGAVRDVTDRKREQEERARLEQKIRESQRLESLGVLAGGIAHDFNNLLTVIAGNAALADSERSSPDAVRKRLDRIRTAADYAVALTDQILTYAGKPALLVSAFDLGQLVVGMLDLLQASASPSCRLETELCEDLPAVDGDATQIRQVIMNLVTNASEALGSAAGRIVLRTGQVYADARYLADSYAGSGAPQPGRYVYVEVEDNGPGVDRDTQQRIFEPFFSTKFSGRGLGLAAVHGIVQAHGGAIKLTSTPGVVTKFRVLLPRSERTVEEPRAPVDARAAAPSDGGGSTVLVVDDDEAVLHLAQEFLARAGFRVVAAAGGAEALQIFQERGDEIDAVVLDLSMPDVDGEQTFVEIRRRRADVPILVVSGFSEEIAAESFPATSGSARFLAKPYQSETLVAQIREVLAD